MTRDTDGIHEGKASLIIPFSMKKPAGAALSARTCIANALWAHQKRILTSHCQVVIYLRNTYTTDDEIAEAYADIFNYSEPEGPQRRVFLAVALEKVPTLWSCVWRVPIKWHLY